MGFPRLRRSVARSTLLGVTALGFLLWGAVTQLGLNVNTLLAQLLVVGAVFLFIVLAAGLCVLVFSFFRRKD